MVFPLTHNRDILQWAHKLQAFTLPLLILHHNHENLCCLKYLMIITHFFDAWKLLETCKNKVSQQLKNLWVSEHDDFFLRTHLSVINKRFFILSELFLFFHARSTCWEQEHWREGLAEYNSPVCRTKRTFDRMNFCRTNS